MCSVQRANFATVRGRALTLETADTAEKKRHGLMGRRTLKEDHGMFFPSKTKQAQSFWMKDTYLPLDMMFVDETNTISKIAERVEPMSLERVRDEACYVIETNGGWAQKNSVQVGDRVMFT